MNGGKNEKREGEEWYENWKSRDETSSEVLSFFQIECILPFSLLFSLSLSPLHNFLHNSSPPSLIIFFPLFWFRDPHSLFSPKLQSFYSMQLLQQFGWRNSLEAVMNFFVPFLLNPLWDEDQRWERRRSSYSVREEYYGFLHSLRLSLIFSPSFDKLRTWGKNKWDDDDLCCNWPHHHNHHVQRMIIFCVIIHFLQA